MDDRIMADPSPSNGCDDRDRKERAAASVPSENRCWTPSGKTAGRRIKGPEQEQDAGGLGVALACTMFECINNVCNEVFAMPITTLSSREFQQNANQAQKATQSGPVFITKRGRPTQVLLSFEEYQRITGKHRNIVEALSMPGLSDIDVAFPRPREHCRPADFS